MKSPEQLKDLQQILSALCDRSLTDEQATRLAEMLRSDSAARAYYFDYLMIHGVFAWDSGRNGSIVASSNAAHAGPSPNDPLLKDLASIDGAKPEELETLVAMLAKRGEADELAASFLPSSASPAVLELAKTSSADELYRQSSGGSWGRRIALSIERHRMGFSLASVALVCCLGTWLATRQFTASKVVWRTAEPVVVQSEEYVATLVGASNGEVNMADRGAAQNGERIAPGDIRLESGVAELIFDSGAKIVLQGPARFTPQSSRGGQLHYGRVVVTVPERSRGFTVQTASAVMSGDGDTFAVLADLNGTTEAHSLEGAMQVTAPTPDGLGSTTTNLIAGEAQRIVVSSDAPVAMVAIPAKPDSFVRMLPLHQLRFPKSLAAYWSFDEAGGPAFDQRGNNHGLVQGGRRVAGIVGRGAVEFDDTHGQAINVGADPSLFCETDSLTIEAMIISHWDGLYASYDEIFRKDGPHRILLSFQNDHNGPKATPPSPPGPLLSFGLMVNKVYQELDMPLDGKEGRPSLEDICDGKRHHVVGTFNGETGEKAIYIDGKKCVSHKYPAKSRVNTADPSPACIGSTLGWEVFQGVIDELAIYHGSLSPEEIARHAEKALQGRSYFEVDEQEARADDI